MARAKFYLKDDFPRKVYQYVLDGVVKAVSIGGTVEESAGYRPGSTYGSFPGLAAQLAPITLYDLPGASTTAWTATDLDNAQIGARISTTSALGNIRITAMWLVVDYTPAAASTTVPSKMMTMGVG